MDGTCTVDTRFSLFSFLFFVVVTGYSGDERKTTASVNAK